MYSYAQSGEIMFLGEPLTGFENENTGIKFTLTFLRRMDGWMDLNCVSTKIQPPRPNHSPIIRKVKPNR